MLFIFLAALPVFFIKQPLNKWSVYLIVMNAFVQGLLYSIRKQMARSLYLENKKLEKELSE